MSITPEHIRRAHEAITLREAAEILIARRKPCSRWLSYISETTLDIAIRRLREEAVKS